MTAWSVADWIATLPGPEQTGLAELRAALDDAKAERARLEASATSGAVAATGFTEVRPPRLCWAQRSKRAW